MPGPQYLLWTVLAAVGSSSRSSKRSNPTTLTTWRHSGQGWAGGYIRRLSPPTQRPLKLTLREIHVTYQPRELKVLSKNCHAHFIWPSSIYLIRILLLILNKQNCLYQATFTRRFKEWKGACGEKYIHVPVSGVPNFCPRNYTGRTGIHNVLFLCVILYGSKDLVTAIFF